MRAFVSHPAGGWSAQIEQHEAQLLAGVFAELADALDAEANRDVLDMMGVNLETGSVAAPAMHPLMFETSFGIAQVSALSTQEVIPDDFGEAEDVKEPSTAGSASSSAAVTDKLAGARQGEGNTVESAVESGLSDDERLQQLDFDPLSQRPAPANPYVRAILRPMSEDPEQAAELRALTTPDLAAQKAAGLRTVAAGLQWAVDQELPVHVKPTTLGLWASAMNDTRLALGWSLGVEDEARADEIELIAQADPELGVYTAYEITMSSVYVALSWWLETLLRAVDNRL